MLTLSAPAKINLTLEVLRKRPDGYHEIRSVMQTVSLCDTLTFEPSPEVSISSDLPGWDASISLVKKAVALLQKDAAEGVSVRVEKRIPLAGGLGGDSSDAAATLRGLSELWKLALPDSRLSELAANLGSDVPFFLRGGTALAEGRGEKLTPLPSLPHMWAVIVVPDVPKLSNKTGQLYGALKRNHFTDGGITQRLVDAIKENREIEPDMLFNTFENVAFEQFAGLDVYRKHLLKLGAADVHLAGSGPTLFTLITDAERAQDLYTRCKDQGIETYLADDGTCKPI